MIHIVVVCIKARANEKQIWLELPKKGDQIFSDFLPGKEILRVYTRDGQSTLTAAPC